MQPEFIIEADNKDITDKIRNRLIEMIITDDSPDESRAVADALEIRLSDRLPIIETPRTGARLDVRIGYHETKLARMGLYIVDEVELAGPPNTMTIRARSADLNLGKTQRTKAWENVTIGDIVTTVAKSCGYQTHVDEGLAATTIDYLAQTEESDLNFLTRLAVAYGAVLKIAGTTIFFGKAANFKTVSGKVLPTVSLHAPDISRYRVVMVQRNKYRAVRARWRDMAAAETYYEQAGSGEPVYSISDSFTDAAAALAAAKSKYDSFQRGAATLNLTTPGNTSFMAEGKVQLQGVRPDVDNTWLVRRVRHRLNSSGYVSELEAETLEETN